MDESLDCALSFFIKSGIPIVVSAKHHILLEMWARMDSGQLFSVFNEWMKRLEYVIEPGGECDTKCKHFTLLDCLFAKIERGSTIFSAPDIPNEELGLQKIHQELVTILGADAYGGSQIKILLQKFRPGDLSFKDAPPIERPPLI
jgi:hypothetical protein